MIWMGLDTILVAGIIMAAVVFSKRPVKDLGSLSDHWVSDHRIDSPFRRDTGLIPAKAPRRAPRF